MALCLFVLFRRYGGVKPVKPGYVALRGLFGSASMITGYMAISLTGPGRAMTRARPGIIPVPQSGRLRGRRERCVLSAF